jgi:cytoskeletal protein RodZ
MKRYNQAGFGIIGMIVVIGVVLAITIGAFIVMKRNHNATSTSKETDTSVTVPVAPKVESTSDLTKAEQTLDDTDVSADASTDSSQIDAQLSGF